MVNKPVSKGLTVKKEKDLSKWYTEVITKSDIMDYTDVSGCMVFKPYSYYMHLRVRKNMKLWHTASARLARRKHNDGRLVIMDRHWPSEQCYSYIFRKSHIFINNGF